MSSHGCSMRKQKWNKGRKNRGLYHTRNSPKNKKQRRNELPFAQGGLKLKPSRKGFSWKKRKRLENEILI